jgi:hypothetical protein
MCSFRSYTIAAELALVLGFAYLPHVVEAEQNFGSPAGADVIK